MPKLYSRCPETAFLLGEDAPEGDPQLIYVANLSSSMIYALEGSAATIWGLLEGCMSLEEISREVADIFAEPVETVTPGVSAFLQELLALNLVEVCLR